MEADQTKKQESSSSHVVDEKWVYDSSLDHKGRVPLRASTGAWKASLFIIGIYEIQSIFFSFSLLLCLRGLHHTRISVVVAVIEFSERLSYFGLATSLIIYLTKVLHYDIKEAAKSVNYWSGVTTLMPLFGGFLADSYLGRFSTVLASSVVYLLVPRFPQFLLELFSYSQQCLNHLSQCSVARTGLARVDYVSCSPGVEALWVLRCLHRAT